MEAEDAEDDDDDDDGTFSSYDGWSRSRLKDSPPAPNGALIGLSVAIATFRCTHHRSVTET